MLKVDTVSRTLNASECIARGCAMMAATLNSSFRVRDYALEECHAYPIKVGWLVGARLGDAGGAGGTLSKMFPEKQCATLFAGSGKYPVTKSLRLERTEEVELTLFYDPVPSGFPPILRKPLILSPSK